jgi:hypothetical protein
LALDLNRGNQGFVLEAEAFEHCFDRGRGKNRLGLTELVVQAEVCRFLRALGKGCIVYIDSSFGEGWVNDDTPLAGSDLSLVS